MQQEKNPTSGVDGGQGSQPLPLSLCLEVHPLAHQRHSTPHSTLAYRAASAIFVESPSKAFTEPSSCYLLPSIS